MRRTAGRPTPPSRTRASTSTASATPSPAARWATSTASGRSPKMKRALVISSHVAASRVGGSAQALALAAIGIDPVVVPTVLFGRHPGWGKPGGGPVPRETFEGMLEGVAAQGLTFDLVLTGYFASTEQVRLAARAC